MSQPDKRQRLDEDVLSACHAARDGECSWEYCPQRHDWRSHCPLDFIPRSAFGVTPPEPSEAAIGAALAEQGHISYTDLVTMKVHEDFRRREMVKCLRAAYAIDFAGVRAALPGREPR